MTSSIPTDAALFCPVCGNAVDQLRVWQEPGSDRVRIFCDACATLPAYTGLPPAECQALDAPAFHRWAGLRMLRHVYEKEHPAAPRA